METRVVKTIHIVTTATDKLLYKCSSSESFKQTSQQIINVLKQQRISE